MVEVMRVAASESVRATARRSVPNKLLANYRLNFEEAHFIPMMSA